MKILLVPALFFAVAPALVVAKPYANTCDAVIVYNRTTGVWSASCMVDGCDAGQGTCTQFQSGQPVGGWVPQACKCSNANDTIVCAMQWWINEATGAFQTAGCRFFADPCGGGGGSEEPYCHNVAAPSIPPVGPVPPWDSCNCQ